MKQLFVQSNMRDAKDLKREPLVMPSLVGNEESVQDFEGPLVLPTVQDLVEGIKRDGLVANEQSDGPLVMPSL